MSELRPLVQQVESCLSGLPSVIKIGPYDWSVGRIIGESENCGMADFAVHHLQIWPANIMSPSHAVGIMLHETLHVIFANQGLDKLQRGKEEREEQIVSGFEAGLISLFRDNPKFINWAKKWLK